MVEEGIVKAHSLIRSFFAPFLHNVWRYYLAGPISELSNHYRWCRLSLSFRKFENLRGQVFFASGDSDYVTGQILTADGGSMC